MMHVAVTRRIPDEGLRILVGAADVSLWEHPLPPSRKDLVGLATGADGLLSLLTDRVDAELLDRLPRLRVVSNMAVGHDNIDLDACTRHGVAVCTTPDVLTETTADFTFALMLAAARRLTEAADAARRGDWRTWEPMGYLGIDVHGAALGIVGMGRIGTAVARRAAGFGMRVRYTSRSPRDVPNAEPVSLETLLAESDFISLHVPLSPETTGLINRRALSLMRPSAIVVNTSRGPVVDTDALVAVLRHGQIGAAALDVTDPEPLPPDHPLLTLPNAVVTPHIASATAATRGSMAELAARNLVDALAGRRPTRCLNPEVLQYGAHG